MTYTPNMDGLEALKAILKAMILKFQGSLLCSAMGKSL